MDLSKVNGILYKFMCIQCMISCLQGITRLERWKRAKNHGLNPPIQVREIIESHENDTRYTEWYVQSKNFHDDHETQYNISLFSLQHLA